ncbi:MAG: phytanoyl-CoA dioxygenase family protein, partial [Alphaproteobacteria bacterium]
LNIVAPDRNAASIAESIAEHGYVIIEALATDLTNRARDELAADIAAAPFGLDEYLGKRTKRVGSLLARSTASRELVVQPLIRALADRILLPHCARYQLNYSGIMHLEPGAKAQRLHRDATLYPVLHPCPPTIMATMWAITDFTADNGATLVAPGSHLWEHDRKPFEDEIVAAEMPAGSVVVFTGGVFHGGGENNSDTVRTGMTLQYTWGWLRQEENQYLANPPEIAQTYSEELRRLIGYDYGGPYLSFVDGGDPHRIFEDNNDAPATRSNPDVDAAHGRIEWLHLGDLQAVPTPVRKDAPLPATTRNTQNS